MAVAGDTFEREEDLEDAALWRDVAGSEDPEKQQLSRLNLFIYLLAKYGDKFHKDLYLLAESGY